MVYGHSSGCYRASLQRYKRYVELALTTCYRLVNPLNTLFKGQANRDSKPAPHLLPILLLGFSSRTLKRCYQLLVVFGLVLFMPLTTSLKGLSQTPFCPIGVAIRFRGYSVNFSEIGGSTRWTLAEELGLSASPPSCP